MKNEKQKLRINAFFSLFLFLAKMAYDLNWRLPYSVLGRITAGVKPSRFGGFATLGGISFYTLPPLILLSQRYDQFKLTEIYYRYLQTFQYKDN